jgi:branched-chain amino acid transport system ATP-binding protein
VALIGANGAGKSTLLETVLGINRVDSGTIRFMGEDITRTLTERIVASGICLIPEGHGILLLMTVLENLQLGAYHLKADFNQYLEGGSHRFSVLAELFKAIVGLNKEGYTILLSEQNARKALQCAYRGYAFETGSIVLSGSAKELASNPRMRQAYLGGYFF